MTTTFVYEGCRKRYSLQNGWSNVHSYEGPHSETEEFLQADLPAGYSELEIVEGKDGWDQVEASYGIEDPTNPGSEEEPGLISRQWFLDVNDEDQPLAAHPNVELLRAANKEWPARIQACVKTYKLALRSALESEDDLPDWDVTYWPKVDDSTQTGALRSLASYYAELLKLNDGMTFPTDANVLRKVETVTALYQIQAARENKGRFFTTDALVASEPTLPVAPLIVATDLAGLFWLKKAPRVDPVPKGLYQITQEYVGAADFYRFVFGYAIGEDPQSVAGHL